MTIAVKQIKNTTSTHHVLTDTVDMNELMVKEKLVQKYVKDTKYTRDVDFHHYYHSNIIK